MKTLIGLRKVNYLCGKATNFIFLSRKNRQARKIFYTQTRLSFGKNTFSKILPGQSERSVNPLLQNKKIPSGLFSEAGRPVPNRMFSPDELIFIAPDRRVSDLSQGHFSRRIWVLALTEPVAAAANRDFLAKVLAAANLNLDKDTLFAEIPPSEPVHFSADLQHNKPAQVLVFGLPPAQIGLSAEFPLYRPIEFYGCTWLFADALSVLEPDKTRKGQLWACLKQMFL